MSNILVNAPKTARRGDVVEIKALIMHPMETGFRPGPNGRIIPRNIITQCIGDPDGINPDFFAVRPTGRFIICSDGLHGEVDDAAIAATAAACADPQTAVDELIRIALEAGGTDNVTVIVLDITGEYAGQKVWHASRLAQQEDLETVSDETLDTIRIQKPANQI